MMLYFWLIFWIDSLKAQIRHNQQQMQIIQKLLQGATTQQLKNHQSYIQLHLKQIMTSINKHLLQDTTKININKYKCYEACYDYYMLQDNKSKKYDKDALWERVQQLRNCKEKCLNQSKEIDKFLDNINFYSKKKINGCSKGCYKYKVEEQKNSCLWQCYNRIDRRYKQYWANQKINIEAKYKI